MAVFISRIFTITPIDDSSNIPIGTVWSLDSGGTFTAPTSGRYQIEMHGGGGAAATYGQRTSDGMDAYNVGASGGGSGEIYTIEMTEGQTVPVTIGAGGTGSYDPGDATHRGNSGGTTTFGSLSVAGGGGGYIVYGGIFGEDITLDNLYNLRAVAGSATGSIASNGATGSVKNGGGIGWHNTFSCAAGQGNVNNVTQTYGDGGAIIDGSGADGQPGAVIVTFLGR